MVALVSLVGCGQKYNHREEKRSEEEALRKELSQALDQGKAVVFSKDSRRSIWVSADKKESFAFHQELPAIGPYVAQVVEPGTYYFAGGKVEVTQPQNLAINETTGMLGVAGATEATMQSVTSAGEAHVAQIIRDQRLAEYSYRTLPVYYGSSLGYGSGYWGGRRGHWGRSHYDRSFHGMSMYSDSERTVKTKVAVHSQTSVWSNVYVVALPHDGRVGASSTSGALVASVTVAPGEALLMDDVFISKVAVELPSKAMENQKRVLPAGASSASSAVITDQSGPFPVTALEITVIPHDRATLPLIGGISSTVREDRHITRGKWLSKESQGLEKVTLVKKSKTKK